MTTVNFALLREGSSDDGLLPHLRTLLVRGGALEAVGASRPYEGSVHDQLVALMDEEGTLDLVFVHRDADARSSTARRQEILEAADAIQLDVPIVPVVPIQELEAWLIVDPGSIRAVVGRPNGRFPLELPTSASIERSASPKELLGAALLAASGTTGRRFQREKRQLLQYRRRLLERLDLDGPLRELSAWQQLERDVAGAIRDLA